MKKFRAVTKTGAVYESDGHLVTISGSTSGYKGYIRPGFMYAVDRAMLGTEGWGSIHSLPQADVPVVGLSLYVADRNEWRLSTPIESLEVFDD